MKEKFTTKTIPIPVDLDCILYEYAKGYKFDPDLELFSTEFFVDINKNKVCFLFGVKEKVDESL